MADTILIGAVAYDPKVVTIWEGFKQWFSDHDLSLDFILYSNYERQVEQHFADSFHVAWNSPLAWLQTEQIANKMGRKAKAIAMRDTDRDLHSVFIVRADCSIKSLKDLGGRRVGVGAHDSPQATLIPLEHMAQAGLRRYEDFEVKAFDLLAGKHGDHIGGEREAIKALLAGGVDAACIIDGNHLLFTQEGTIPAGSTRIIEETGSYDHCNFTALDGAPEDLVNRFHSLLMSMKYDDPKVRPLFDLEGLKVWKQGRTEGYALLSGAAERFGNIESFVNDVAGRKP